MLDSLKKYNLGEFIRYLVVGVLTTVLSTGAYFLFFYWLENGSCARYAGRIATILSWIIAVIFAFFANKFTVFKSQSMSPRVFWREFALFVGCRTATLIFDFAFIWVTVDYLAFTPWAATWAPFYAKLHGYLMKLIDDFFVTIVNYVISKFLIFTKKGGASDVDRPQELANTLIMPPEKFDLILPLYKPHAGWEKHVVEALTKLRPVFLERNWHLHLILVNDGSDLKFFPEETLAMIRRAAGDDFEFLSYSPNHGKGYCLRYGVARSQGDCQIYTDGDFPFGWESVVAAAEKLAAGADIVMGVRGNDYGAALSSSRKIISSGVRCLNRLILGLPDRFLDTQAGMKGFNANGKRAFLAAKTESFLFDTEFVLLGNNAKMVIDTVNLQLRPGLHFSKMGFKVICRELRHFIRILFQVRICGKMRKK